MSLHLVSTPIGHSKDITLHALEILGEADIIVGEEFKNLEKLLKKHCISCDSLKVLNEHSSREDIQNLFRDCEHQKVALISDGGTPCFWDPGVELVHLCRKKKISVRTAPGASSLMCFLSACGFSLSSFYFQGFLSQKNQMRQKELEDLQRVKVPVIFMDTPYRLKKLLKELDDLSSNSFCVLGTDLTTGEELFLNGQPCEVLQGLERSQKTKRNFILLWAKRRRDLVSETMENFRS